MFCVRLSEHSQLITVARSSLAGKTLLSVDVHIILLTADFSLEEAVEDRVRLGAIPGCR